MQQALMLKDQHPARFRIDVHPPVNIRRGMESRRATTMKSLRSIDVVIQIQMQRIKCAFLAVGSFVGAVTVFYSILDRIFPSRHIWGIHSKWIRFKMDDWMNELR